MYSNEIFSNNTNSLKTTANSIKYILGQLHNQPIHKEGPTTTTTCTTKQPCTARPTKDPSPLPPGDVHNDDDDDYSHPANAGCYLACIAPVSVSWWRHQMEKKIRVSVPLCGKGQWRGALFFFICAWIYAWVNYREAGDLRCYRARYDVIAMWCWPVVESFLYCWLLCGVTTGGRRIIDSMKQSCVIAVTS